MMSVIRDRHDARHPAGSAISGGDRHQQRGVAFDGVLTLNLWDFRLTPSVDPRSGPARWPAPPIPGSGRKRPVVCRASLFFVGATEVHAELDLSAAPKWQQVLGVAALLFG